MLLCYLPERDLELTIKWHDAHVELENHWELNLMSRNLAESEIPLFTKNGMCSKSWDSY